MIGCNDSACNDHSDVILIARRYRTFNRANVILVSSLAIGGFRQLEAAGSVELTANTAEHLNMKIPKTAVFGF